MKELSLIHHKLLRYAESLISPGAQGGDIYKALLRFLNQYNPEIRLVVLDLNVNSVVCHGGWERIIVQDSDIVTVDVVLEWAGIYADGAWTCICGRKTEERSALLLKAWELSKAAACEIMPGRNSLSMKKSIHNLLRNSPCFLVEEACGHGIGSSIHEAPDIHYQITDHNDLFWKEGMIITVEPVILWEGQGMEVSQADIWVNPDRKDAAYFEHMLFLGPEEALCLNIPELFNLDSIDIFQEII